MLAVFEKSETGIPKAQKILNFERKEDIFCKA